MCGFINHRFVKLPDTLGMTAVGLAISAAVTALGVTHPEMTAGAKALIQQIDFTDVVFHGLLSLLLFAGALHVDLTRLRQHRIAIFTLATVGVLISTVEVGGGFYLLMATARPWWPEILITLALATAGDSLAAYVHGSAPLAVVIMGLVIGNVGTAAIPRALASTSSRSGNWPTSC